MKILMVLTGFIFITGEGLHVGDSAHLGRW